jgi:peptidoglycan/LPS O-acetylase OafA/YrhL
VKRAIPSLDGLRAVSVTLVILSHIDPGHFGPLGLFGVRVFFVISGYLITGLLLREQETTGTIRLSRFYLRRTLRIFPAYYAMLAVAYAIGTPAHWSWLVSYTSNVGPPQPFVVGHAWSLGVEEQFYLLWPAVLLAAGRVRGRQIAIAVLALMPVVRVAWFLIFHNGRPMFATPDDFLAAGCVLALSDLRAPRWGFALLPAVAAYHLAFAMSYRWRFVVDITVGETLCAIAIATAIAHAVTSTTPVLNNRVLRTLGIGSYSIYLYQQFWAHQWWPVAICGTLACAAASYLLIERPGLRVREWIEMSHISPAVSGPKAAAR